MKVELQHNHKTYWADLSVAIDISIPLSDTDQNPIAWYLDKPIIQPVEFDNWIGAVRNGSSTNFNTISFNPHAHGTHTECLGHITFGFYSINHILKKFFFMAELISVVPEKIGEDYVITKELIQKELSLKSGTEALVVRTLPNTEDKKHKKYSHTNPPYLSEEATVFIVEQNIQHLLIDLPSVDKEKDNGVLAAHKAFWNLQDVVNIDEDARLGATITEMIYVPEAIEDGTYLLNLQIASIENDASPSKPVLYSLTTENNNNDF
jgi:kynurenine formamidase